MRRLHRRIGFSYDVSNSYGRDLPLQVEDFWGANNNPKALRMPKKAHVGLALITVGQSPLADEGILFATG